MFTLKTEIGQFKKNTDKKNKKYKVLLNAGGGAFGYVITYLMSHLNYDIYKHIDVAAGTSIGGILTLLYSVTPDYKWVNSLFERGCPKIFRKRLIGGISGPYYDNKELAEFISHVVGDYKLSDINKVNDKNLHVIVPTLDFTLTQPRVFDNINLDLKMDMDLKTIALATAAAPTYFPAIEYIWKM
jgi:patatin-like phospholipase/acyl hydrolase